MSRGVRRPVAAAWTTSSPGETTEEAADIISVREWTSDTAVEVRRSSGQLQSSWWMGCRV